MSNMNTLDITPTPRILRTLGEIPFQTWQCIAELIDNSVDAFLSNRSAAYDVPDQRISVTWSSDSVAASQRTIEIADNACGMSIEQLQNAVRADIRATILSEISDCLVWVLISLPLGWGK